MSLALFPPLPQKAGVLVPHYCWHPGLTVVANCRMCLVEFGELKDGKVLIPPKVFPGCQTSSGGMFNSELF